MRGSTHRHRFLVPHVGGGRAQCRRQSLCTPSASLAPAAASRRADLLHEFGREVQAKTPRAVVAAHLQHPPWIIRVGLHQIPGGDVHGVGQPQQRPLMRQRPPTPLTLGPRGHDVSAPHQQQTSSTSRSVEAYRL